MKTRHLTAAALLLLAAGSRAGEIGSYAMTQVTTAPDGTDQATVQWFVTPDKSRTEMPARGDNPMGAMVVIARKDKGVVWTLFPDRKAYLESPLEEEKGRAEQIMKGLQADQTVEDLGKDEILGYDCTKQRIRSTVEIGPRRIDTENLVWKCEGFDVPLRIRTAEGSLTETTAVEVGPQPEKLFEPPPGYRKAASFMELMGGAR